MIPIIGALAELLPDAVSALFGSDDGKTVRKAAQAVMDVAGAVTGHNEPDAAANALRNNPKMLVKFREQVAAETIALYAEDTKRLVAVNETMRSEAASGNKLQACWRPVFGLVAAGSFGVQSLALAAIPFLAPDQAGPFSQMVTSMSQTWAIALTVLGVSVYSRSGDKRRAAGAKGGIAEMVEALRK